MSFLNIELLLLIIVVIVNFFVETFVSKYMKIRNPGIFSFLHNSKHECQSEAAPSFAIYFNRNNTLPILKQ